MKVKIIGATGANKDETGKPVFTGMSQILIELDSGISLRINEWDQEYMCVSDVPFEVTMEENLISILELARMD